MITTGLIATALFAVAALAPVQFTPDDGAICHARLPMPAASDSGEEAARVNYVSAVDGLVRRAWPEEEPEPGELDLQDPIDLGLVRQFWGAAADFAAAYLNNHPDAESEDLAGALSTPNRITPWAHWIGPSATAVHLIRGGTSGYAIALNFDRAGTIFVVAKHDGRFVLAWDIKDVAEQNFRRHDELGYWAYTYAGIGDGPLTGAVHSLPSGADGDPRFYVDATSNPRMGMTHPKQISVWKWSGIEAVPLFMQCYSVAENGEVELTPDASELRLHTKEELKQLWFCGQCDEPAGIWTLRITPDGVIDAGHQLSNPDLQLVDDVIDGIKNGTSTDNIARPVVADQIAAVALQPDWRGFAEWTSRPGRSQTIMHLSTEGCGNGTCEFILAIERSSGNPKVAGVRLIQVPWTRPYQKPSQDPASDPNGITALASNPSAVYAARGRFLLRSVERGTSWSPLEPLPEGAIVQSIALVSQAPQQIYTGTRVGLYSSVDAGRTWHKLPVDVPHESEYASSLIGSDVVVDPAAPNVLYLGDRWIGIVKSTDGGQTGRRLQQAFGVTDVYSLALDAASPQVLYTGTTTGILKTEDGGDSWTPSGSAQIDTLVLALTTDPTHHETVYAGTFGMGIFKTTDAGRTWSAINDGLDDLHIQALAINPADPHVLYAGCEPGLFETMDGGAHWHARHVGDPDPIVTALAVDDSPAHHVFVGTADGRVLVLDANR